MVGDRGGERGYLEICGCEKEGESTFSVREQLKGTIEHHGNAVSGIEAVLTGDTSTPANQTTTQQHTRTSKTGGKDMLNDVGLTAATTGMDLHDIHSAAHTSEDEGAITITSCQIIRQAILATRVTTGTIITMMNRR